MLSAQKRDVETCLSLVNTLLHDGYFKRRFGILTFEEQERYDQILLLREFVTRLVFALLDIGVPIHSIVNPSTTTNIRNQAPGAPVDPPVEPVDDQD